MPGELWLIRHGETEWSRSGAHTGRTDIPLTETGRQQAEAIRRLLNGRPFAMVLTSPLERARETCELAGYRSAAEIDPNLHEWDYGDCEGKTTGQIREQFPGWSIWNGPVPHGETIDQVAARARAILEHTSHAEGDVALFAHGHILRILTACWLELPPEAGRFFALGTASVSTLGHEHENRVITRWNLTEPNGA